MGLAVPQRVRSPCTGRQVLYHWARGKLQDWVLSDKSNKCTNEEKADVAVRIMASKNISPLIPRSCEYITVDGKREPADVFKNSEMGAVIMDYWGRPNVIPSESRSVVSDSLRPHGLKSPWNSPGQNTGAGNLSLLQGIFPTQGSNPGLPHRRRIPYQLSHQGSQYNPNGLYKWERVARHLEKEI